MLDVKPDPCPPGKRIASAWVRGIEMTREGDAHEGTRKLAAAAATMTRRAGQIHNERRVTPAS
jgi:hypothetical protein